MNDRLLATLLAGVAGAVNAGGFFVVGQYTSHMTGYLSQVADNLAIGNFIIVVSSVVAILAFVFGAACSAFLVNWARQHHYAKQYAVPIAPVQGGVLLLFSFAGSVAGTTANVVLLMILCFLMGMQNATITKLSKARIRTTHVTGMVTDIGIELGRFMFGKVAGRPEVTTDSDKLATLLRLVLAYLFGGIAGAVGFANAGFIFALPLSLLLLLVSLPTLLFAKRGRMTR